MYVAAKEIENKFGKGSAFAYGIDITDRKKVYTLADKVKKEVSLKLFLYVHT